MSKPRRKRTRKIDPNASSTSAEVERPRKRFFRQRAHCNPLSRSDGFDYPQTPEDVSFWEPHFTQEWLTKFSDPSTEIYADVGCGFGGLLMGLAELYPHAISIGFEIRQKVTEYVKQRISHLRQERSNGEYQNVSVLRANAMRYLPNFFKKGQLTKMFFCFPDPQFKKKKHRRRIISDGLLAEYAYLLRPGGRLYHITDVPELHEWMKDHCKRHPCFRQIPEEQLVDDPAVPCMREATEEGQKVARGGGSKYYCVYERVPDEEALATYSLKKESSSTTSTDGSIESSSSSSSSSSNTMQ
jgi:tRNA (guanine-N7-)-methyltransferase|tara:strand:+ start:178 stop:1074 length:897 start_codon:yes stop_codon:yes gene_type:complete